MKVVKGMCFRSLCEETTYRFYFMYNEEEIEADYCFSNLNGTSYCTLNNVNYYNVEHYSISTRTFVQKENFLFSNSLLNFVLVAFCVFIIYKLVFEKLVS